jgi:large subunit ribosomal protein L6
MSRIGNLPIKIPLNEVNIEIKKNIIQVKGKQGNLMLKIPKEITLNISDNLIIVKKTEETKNALEKHGLIRSLLNNMILGVVKKFQIKLLMVGVGYKAQLSGGNLILNVGFSHPISFLIPNGIEISIETNTILMIKGCDKEKVGLFAAKIRAIRPPEPYKGKGICYHDEIISRKDGKSGK